MVKVPGEGVNVTSVPRFGLPVDDRRGPDDLQRRDRVAAGEFDQVLESVAPDAQHEPRRERIDDGDADAVQSARDLVGVLVEFAARMQLGHDDFGGRDAFFVVDAGRNAAPVVGDGARAVGVERHGHELGVAGQRLVDRVVDDLVDHVVEAGAVVGVADIHARPLAHRVEAAQDLDRIRAIGVAGGLAGAGQVLALLVQIQSLFLRLAHAPPRATRIFVTLACRARKCTFCRRARPCDILGFAAIFPVADGASWGLSGPGGREFAPRRRAQQRLVARDGA